MKVKQAQKPRQGLDERDWNLAIEVWYNWYLSYVLPPEKVITSVGVKDAEENVYEAFGRAIRGNTDHSDAPLQKIIAEEDRGSGWPASIHAIILDMPPMWQLIIWGSAKGVTQTRMAEIAGVSQSGVSAALSLVKSRFLMRLRIIGATQGKLTQITKVHRPSALSLRPAVID